MTVNFMGYELELKAKQPLLNKRYNKKDTLTVINSLICLMYDSADKSQLRAEIAESLGKEKDMKIYLDYKEILLRYAHELTKDYENYKYE